MHVLGCKQSPVFSSVHAFKNRENQLSCQMNEMLPLDRHTLGTLLKSVLIGTDSEEKLNFLIVRQYLVCCVCPGLVSALQQMCDESEKCNACL